MLMLQQQTTQEAEGGGVVRVTAESKDFDAFIGHLSDR